MKFLASLIPFLFVTPAFALSLIQETREIHCQSANHNLVIAKNDSTVTIDHTIYKSIEFLDLAILAASKEKTALVQMTPQNTATVIVGALVKYKEYQCQQVGDSKRCVAGSWELLWSPTSLEINGQVMPVQNYGTYPNDGTYFIAYNSKGEGAAIVDFGENFSLIVGQSTQMNCAYAD